MVHFSPPRAHIAALSLLCWELRSVVWSEGRLWGNGQRDAGTDETKDRHACHDHNAGRCASASPSVVPSVPSHPHVP
eukprot:2647780-Prymnesium_polylepis.1